MVGKRRNEASSTDNISEAEEVPMVDDSDSDVTVAEYHQSASLRLRRRWELACVLNFLHVFEPVIKSGLKISAEEIETALILANDTLARIHIAILKGIPPASKNLQETDMWVTLVCKKLAPWWPWVAEGENPLKYDHGEERKRYKELDPISRLLMLKALCEVRVDQDDILRHINDDLKAQGKLTTYRKEKIGSDDNGITYWYDGDPDVGYRLYREVVKFDMKPLSNRMRHSMLPEIQSECETLATNIEEFREISEKLSSSTTKVETHIGEIIRTDFLPVIEENQKKKERALKRKQRKATLLDNYPIYSRVGTKRTCRQRKPVSYTFDEFDRSINEAITQMSKKLHAKGGHGGGGKQSELLSNDKSNIRDDDKYHGSTDDKSEDADYDAGHDDINSSGDSDNDQNQTQCLVQDGKDDKPKLVVDMRRSIRNVNNTNGELKIHAGMKKRLRQRPIPNPGYTDAIVPDSEDDIAEHF